MKRLKKLFYLPFFIMLFFTIGCLGEFSGFQTKPVGSVKTVYNDDQLMDMAQDSAANQKVTELAAVGTFADPADLLYVITDVAGTPTSKSITVSNFYLSPTITTPTITGGITSPGTVNGGQFIYFLEATGTGANYFGWGSPSSNNNDLILLGPISDPTAGQSLVFGVPSSHTFSDNVARDASQATWVDAIGVKSDFIPILYANDGTTAPATAALVTSTNSAMARAFDGAANEDVKILWVVPGDIDTSVGIKFSVVGYVGSATAPANSEIVAFSLAGVSFGNSDIMSGAVGTAQTSSLTADATYVQYDKLETAFSSAITVTNLTVGETAHLNLIRLATTTDTYAQDFHVVGIKIKYQRLNNDTF